MKNFSINGFGRIGRTFLRVWWEKGRENSNLKAINTSGSMEIDQWAHLLKYDTNYGVFPESIKVNKIQSVKDATDENPVLGNITVGEHEIAIIAQRDPKKIPWAKYEVEVVVEATGIFNTEEKGLWAHRSRSQESSAHSSI